MKPPEYLGPYQVGDSLGRGGMGTVYKAKHAKSGDDVAVKLIAQHVSDEMKFRRRFHAEIETLKRLKHPNIVRLIGYGEEHGMLFYSMELVSGQTLQSIIRTEKRLAWMRTLDIAIQICSALKHAHDIGVIHRDLKPANLIIEQDDTVKLVDFGISKIFGHDQTAAGSIMGTADYMAPEQATNSG
ncbi:MAG: serine/threonine-protein kinase, partial [Planctomycetota bacterium]